jgi:hypothetical protein
VDDGEHAVDEDYNFFARIAWSRVLDATFEVGIPEAVWTINFII